MKKKIKALLVILIYVGLILINTRVYGYSGKLLNDNTRLRKETSTTSQILDLISIGDKFEILSEEGEWYKVTYKGKTGYIRKDMIKVEENQTNTSNEVQNTQSSETNQENTENSNTENTTEDNNKNVIQKGYKGKIASNLDLKILPTIFSNVIATVYSNTEIQVKEVINKWAYIETENNSGWVLLGKINTANNLEEQQEDSKDTNTESNKEENSQEQEQKEDKKTSEENKTEEKKEEVKTVKKYVSVETLNMRQQAENNAKVIKQLTLNSEVTVLETVDSTWSKVKYQSSTGYVASKYLSDTKTKVTTRSEETSRQQAENNTAQVQNKKEEEKKQEETQKQEEKKETTSQATSSSSTSGASVVAYAKQFLGNPYVYGGTSLTNGCDCSGFVMSVYKNFGISLPHASSSQKSVGTAVDKGNLQAGDIVCFSGHVGIYIGGNNFIHAANPSKGIIISSLSESYYKSKYLGARRVI